MTAYALASVQYLSLFKYSFAAVMQNEFVGLKFTCDEEDSRPWLQTLDESTRFVVRACDREIDGCMHGCMHG
jgi:hypothetical protein